MLSDVDRCIWSSVPAEYVLILSFLYYYGYNQSTCAAKNCCVCVRYMCRIIFFLLCCVLALFLGARYWYKRTLLLRWWSSNSHIPLLIDYILRRLLVCLAVFLWLRFNVTISPLVWENTVCVYMCYDLECRKVGCYVNQMLLGRLTLVDEISIDYSAIITVEIFWNGFCQICIIVLVESYGFY